MTVDKLSAEASAVISAAALPRTLFGGTESMRAAGKKYLPLEPAETEQSYLVKLNRAVFFNAFAKTVKDMAGRVFAKEVMLGDDVPPQIAPWCENVDMTGRHLNVFARDVFQDALTVGLAHILVDTPATQGEITRADAQAMGARPYMVHLRAEDIIGWQSSLINGAQTLTQLRFYESVTEPDGVYGQKTVTQIKVLNLGSYEIHRKNEKGEWMLWAEGMRGIDAIPLATVYTNRTGFMQATPPLKDLCDLNVAHWQSGADQRNILHVARVPIMFGAGFPSNAALVIGAGAITTATDKDAKLSFVEHSGAAIEAGRQDLQDLEQQMQIMGLQMLIPNPGQSATGEIRDDIKETSQLAAMANGLKDGLENALAYMAQLGGIGDDGGSVNVNTDFGITSRGIADLTVLLQAVTSGVMSRKTFWAELARRGVLSEAFDPEGEELQVIEDLVSGVVPDNQA